MKKYSILIIAFILASCNEDDGPSTARYVDDIFENVIETTTIQYGENAALLGSSRVLYLNVFEPEDDDLALRPAIVLAHGGAFISGTRSNLKSLCEAYAKKGYVAITIDYRLINDISVDSDTAFSEGVVLALGDMKAAIRFIRNDAENENTYGVDPSLIFAGGVSAGAVMANHIGFLDEEEEMPEYLRNHLETHGGFEGNSNNINTSSEVSGVISFSGSLFDANWIDSNDPPLFMVHEEFDPIVPCGFAASEAFPFEIFAYGGCSLSERANEVGILNEFVFVSESTNHVGYLSDDNSETIINSSAAFLASIISSKAE